MAFWFSLRATLRGLLREAVRGVWARWLVYPQLVANERDSTRLQMANARRLRALGLAPAPGTPLIDKAAVRAAPARFVRPRRWGSLLRATIRTSGTSGTPLALTQSLSCVIREEAFVYRQLRWIGYRHGQRRAWLRGDIVCAARPRQAVYWCRDWASNMLLLSSYHLADATIGAYIAALERFDPVVLHAYPSSVAALAAWLNAHGRHYQGRALRGVMTSSETLAPAVRHAIQTAFRVPVFDWYGQAERVAAIGTCEHGRYHLLSDYSVVEVLADGELVGTSLNNSAMALARYRTGDTVTLGGGACPCGRIFPVVDAIAGRQENIIVLPDGRRIGRLDRVFQGQQDALVEGQVVYRGDGRFTLRVVTCKPFDDCALLAAFRLRVPGVEVQVAHVDAIPRGPNGKFAFVTTEPGGPVHAPGRVLMFGTDPAGRGGIAATVASWRAAAWFAREGVRYVPSHVDGARRAKLAVFIEAVVTLLRMRPRIVHVHAASHASFYRKALLLALARARGCRTVFHLHGGGFAAFAASRVALVRHTLLRCDAVLALSAHWADYVRTLAPGAPVHVLPNAVALPAQALDRVEPGRILFVGRLEAAKGVDELSEAAARLAPRYPMLRLVLAGSGAYQHSAAHLELAGWIDADHRAEQLQRAAIFCLPSHAEGLPLALLEAMAAGKAIVASAVGAIPEALAPDAGLLVPPRDVDALAAALEQLLADPLAAAAMGARARSVVAARYDSGQVDATLSSLYRALDP
ncbi:glycosyltransferase [Massilia sp. S19_KUP03_FR1]|uniref:glycosyltransferase n=1 Tax=Massilia sp. S19_KUP03_FR1 TaxID=3025503 RepID=UPI002FCCD471